MFQLWSDWKRKSDNNKEQNSVTDNITRTCSMTSTSSTSPSNWSLDWNQKKALSFKEDYVSFPSLEPSASELTCSN